MRWSRETTTRDCPFYASVAASRLRTYLIDVLNTADRGTPNVDRAATDSLPFNPEPLL